MIFIFLVVPSINLLPLSFKYVLHYLPGEMEMGLITIFSLSTQCEAKTIEGSGETL